MTASALLAELQRWTAAGWIRRLDSAFASFIHELCSDAAPEALLAVAMTAHMEGRGHACLVVGDLVRAAEELLGWKPEAAAAMQALLARLPAGSDEWLDALGACNVVLRPAVRDDEGTHRRAEVGNASVDRGQPLVLSGERLYLRRYWNYERRVAAQIMARVAVANGFDEAAAARSLDQLFTANAVSRSATDLGTNSATESGMDSAMTLATNPAPNSSTRGVDWQRIACAISLRSGLALVTGGPGTGKTYTVARMLALLFATAPDPARLRVALAAPTGKAAARLKQSIDAALADIAAQGGALPMHDLSSRIGPARTLHSLLGARGDTRCFRFHCGNPLEVDVVVVDEASMVHLEMMDALLDALPTGAKLVLLGDKDQLASVEAGAVLGDLCRDAEAGRYSQATRAFVRAVAGEEIPSGFVEPGDAPAPALAQQTVMLRQSRRFQGAIGKLAAAVNEGDAAGARALLESGGLAATASAKGSGEAAEGARADAGSEDAQALHWLRSTNVASLVKLALQGRTGAAGGYRTYLDLVRRRAAAGNDEESHAAWVREVLAGFDQFRVLCAVRDGDWGVTGVNRAVESALVEAGLLTKAPTGGPWYEGRPVLITRNDYAAGVFNGDVGIALRSAGDAGTLRVYFPDGAQLRSVMASRLSDAETAFAMTVHKSQGSEFDHTVLVLPAEAPRMLTRELVYTGITRARRALTLVTPKGDALETALAQRTRRASGLPALLNGN